MSRIVSVIRIALLAAGSASIVFAASFARAQDAPKPGDPTDEKARKTYAEGMDWEKHHRYGAAIDSYRKANKQDGGHCKNCLDRAYMMANRIEDYKTADEIAGEMMAQATTPAEKASVHYLQGLALLNRGISDKKEQCFNESCDELKASLDLQPSLTIAHYTYGVSLAHLHQDTQAHDEFAAFLAGDHSHSLVHGRAERFVDHVDLARAKLAPAFSVTTLDGKSVTMDGLVGKVVLIDFWATWCGPCREALPHVRQIAQKFAGQPLVILSVSLDSDEAKWKEFVGKNGMTWLQYRDGGFDGALAHAFHVRAIPSTFSIDADGVLEDQHVGDADIEAKLKKMVAHAAEAEKTGPAQAAGNSAPSAQ